MNPIFAITLRAIATFVAIVALTVLAAPTLAEARTLICPYWGYGPCFYTAPIGTPRPMWRPPKRHPRVITYVVPVPVMRCHHIRNAWGEVVSFCVPL